MNKLKKLLFISSALLLSTANNTFAAAPTGTITASGTVTGTCTVTASNMAFGTLSTSATTNTATSTVTPTCTIGTGWTVTNAGNTNNLYLAGDSGAGAAGTIAFPIKLTGVGGEDFTLSNAVAGKLTGVGTGSSQNASPTLTGIAGSSTDKSPGVYSGTVTLTITY
jgi:spore coat protein U-like protein